MPQPPLPARFSKRAFVVALRADKAPFESHLCRGGFPHSDICGSMLVCQLPAAFRRLPRPSSPVIAKASTTCTLLLDPITGSPLRLPASHPPATGSLTRLGCTHPPLTTRTGAPIQSSNPVRSAPHPHPTRTNTARTLGSQADHQSLYFFQFVKEQPASVGRGQFSVVSKTKTTARHSRAARWS